MIIARICKPGAQELFSGSCDIKGYYEGGWFPVESFSFGFEQKTKTEKSGDNSTGAAATKSSPSGPRTSTGGPPLSGKNDEGFSTMSLQKQVEMATCELMELAMKERSKKKGADKELELHADIHVLGSVAIKDGDTAVKHVYPSVMIHLERVRVLSWSINGSGNERPSESLTLEYDYGAMHYLWTRDGAIFQAIGPRGWDQKDNVQWRPDVRNCDWKKYLPPNCR